MMYFTEENGEIKVITGDLFDQKETRILVRDIFQIERDGLLLTVYTS